MKKKSFLSRLLGLSGDRRERHSRRQLRYLDDRLLRDIGLHRGDLGWFDRD
jgi:uncharacterized protein YjiS (DUF1127 family)